MTDWYHPDDTIAALASAPGPANRGIVRLSGPDAKESLARVFTPANGARWRSVKQAWSHPGLLALPELTTPLAADVLLWPTRRSYTGQSLAEIHTIGSPPLLEAVLSSLFDQGVRPAERGEFTLRAFLAGRVDLLQAEAVLGVIDATDQQQLKAALGQLGGGLSSRFNELHEELLLHLADLEAGLDFVEEDIEFLSRDELLARLEDGIEFLEDLVSQSSSRLQSTGRRKVVLAGLPNAGKSTLFNALAGIDHALVSEVAGTTRDYLSASLDWDGVPLELIDTAGWDGAAAGIGKSADQLRQEQWERADLIVWCSSSAETPNERESDRRQRCRAEQTGLPTLFVATKSDCFEGEAPGDPISVCALSGEGVPGLRTEIRRRLQQSDATNRLIGSTSARCRDSLVGAGAALARARSATVEGAGEEIVAIELRESVDHLGKIVGRVYADDVLDRIFSRFCIGK